MNLIKKTALSLALLFMAGPAAAQIINDSAAGDFADRVGQNAGFSDLSIGFVISMLIRGALSVIGLIFVIQMIVAGFRWMNSGGNEETIKKAQNTIKNSIIGVILILAAWAITYFVFKVLPFSSPASTTMGAE